MGPGTHSIPVSLFRDNRNRVCAELKQNPSVDASTFILLQGGDNIPFYDTDTDYVFRQVKMAQSSHFVKFINRNKTKINAYRILAELRNHFSYISLAFVSQDAMVQSMFTLARRHCLCHVCLANMQYGWVAWIHARTLQSNMVSMMSNTLTK